MDKLLNHTRNAPQIQEAPGGLSSFTLHILAMALMLLDHLFGTGLSNAEWMTCVGRIAFPIFAFLIVEGYCHTGNFKRYLLRMALFALLSEIPFDLMMQSSFFFPIHQNVLFTFTLALLCMRAVDAVRKKHAPVVAYLLGGLIILGFYLLALFTFVDYYGYGLLMVMVFYVFRGERWYHKLLQAAGIICINVFMMKGLEYPLTLLGFAMHIPQQAFAILALIPIFLYRGKQGPHTKPIRTCFYAFYPVHMLVLGLIKYFL